jgi:pimeloyl-ACP methyl ester carboxylesterase
MPYADSNGVKIWWEEHGTGAPLLLVMGFGHGGRLWGELVEHFAATHRVLVVDNRGCGQSDEAEGPYTVPQMAADSIAVLDAAGVAAADVFGVSLGGVIAQEIALTYPERVRRLVLGCTACPEHSEGGSRIGLSLLLLGRLMPRPMAGRLARPYSYDRSTTDELWASIDAVKSAAAAPMRTIWRQARAGLHETCSRVAAIDKPALVIHGVNDRLIPIGNGRRLAELIPEARVVEIDGAGHMFMLEQAEATVAAVEGFLAG